MAADGFVLLGCNPPAMADERVKGALRELLLPIRPEREAEATEAATTALAESSIREDDQVKFLEVGQEKWRAFGEPDGVLAKVTRAYLLAGEPEFGDVLSKEYFTLHRKIAARAQFDHNLASALLSHARLIAVLGIEDRLSAAQIAQLLSQRNPRLPSSWEAVQTVLGAIGNKPKLDQERVKELFEADVALEEEAFKDGSLPQCVEMVGRRASGLGLPPLFEEGLLVLATDPVGPHLKMLHFLCVIAEYFDHPLEFAYEFSPRGKIATWIAERYPPSLGRTGSDFLNNAKSVDVLNRDWANSKKKSLSAHALITVVESLSSLGFSARRELATWIRRLLLRIIRLEADTEVDLPKFDLSHIENLASATATGQTNTFGILEQRIVDAISVLSYPLPDWVPRGLGDSVNATNMSRKKLGDCDFQCAKNRQVVAFEPHAGKLTDVYVQGHELTLKRVLQERSTEWEQTVGEGEEWSVAVTFVAHEIPSDGVISRIDYGPAVVEIRATTFEDFISGINLAGRETKSVFAEFVRAPLMDERTPEAVRRKVKEIVQ
jgi:hypothetical protein